MPFETKAVSFEYPINQGFRLVSGLLKLEGGELRLEFQTKDALLGVLKSDIEQVGISLRDLQSVELRKGWFSTKVILESRSLKVFQEIPGSENGRLVLKVDRKERPEAEKLVSAIRLAHSELRLNDLQDDTE